jgi:uncharacterized membrane protein
MFDQRRKIMELEHEIERLSLSAERCRKIMLASKVAAAAGALILLCLVLGVLRFQPAVFLAALTAVLAGLALLGTHASTLDEVVATLKDREAQRSGMIDGLELRSVDAR